MEEEEEKAGLVAEEQLPHRPSSREMEGDMAGVEGARQVSEEEEPNAEAAPKEEEEEPGVMGVGAIFRE